MILVADQTTRYEMFPKMWVYYGFIRPLFFACLVVPPVDVDNNNQRLISVPGATGWIGIKSTTASISRRSENQCDQRRPNKITI